MGPVLLALGFGLAFGSFLNVVWTRLPKGESVIAPGSHCRSCGAVLAWFDNIPVASWLALRGRCRRCHARIPARYVMVELAGGIAAAVAAAWWLRGAPLEAARAGLEAAHG